MISLLAALVRLKIGSTSSTPETQGLSSLLRTLHHKDYASSDGKIAIPSLRLRSTVTAATPIFCW